LSFFFGTAPVIATVMMTGSGISIFPELNGEVVRSSDRPAASTGERLSYCKGRGGVQTSPPGGISGSDK
jgi:hypothetical protein